MRCHPRVRQQLLATVASMLALGSEAVQAGPANLEPVLQLFAQGSPAPLYFEFERYIYDTAALTERRAVGRIWRESPTEWRMDVSPSPHVPPPDQLGQRLNPNKRGPNQQPYTIVVDTPAAYLRRGPSIVWRDARGPAADARHDPFTIWSSVIEVARLDSWAALGDWLQALRDWPPGQALSEMHPAAIGAGHDPAALRRQYYLSLGPKNGLPGQSSAPCRFHLVLHSKNPTPTPAFSRIELLIDQASGRCAAVKYLDGSGQTECVYVFHYDNLSPAGEIRRAINIHAHALLAQVPLQAFMVPPNIDSMIRFEADGGVSPSRLSTARKLLGKSPVDLNEVGDEWVLTGTVASQAEADRWLALIRSQRRPARIVAVRSALVIEGQAGQ
jgi:hypothetical protein